MSDVPDWLNVGQPAKPKPEVPDWLNAGQSTAKPKPAQSPTQTAKPEAKPWPSFEPTTRVDENRPYLDWCGNLLKWAFAAWLAVLALVVVLIVIACLGDNGEFALRLFVFLWPFSGIAFLVMTALRIVSILTISANHLRNVERLLLEFARDKSERR